jgi:hypothetical protein
VRRIGGRYAQLRLAAPVVAARGDRVVLRTHTTLGGGRVIDPAPPRHASAERIELLEQGDAAATVHSPVRLSTLRHVLDGEPAGLRRAGDWVFSDAWLAELQADLDQRLAAADELDPGIAPPAEPWAADVLPLLPLERRGAKLYRPGAHGELGARAKAADELEARLGLEPVKVDDRSLDASSRPRGGSYASATDLPSRRRPTRRQGACFSPSARRRAASPSRDSATSSAWVAARPSSCSSASTPTG